MTNLEFYKDEIKRLIHNEKSVSISECVGKAFEKFCSYHIDKYPFNSKRFIDWLLEEHKKKVKLTKFECDLLKSIALPSEMFRVSYTPSVMKELGYFKGVTDTAMTIKEILQNCEVEEDDEYR